MSSEKSPHDETASIGRGALFLTFTKFWFLISGYVIYGALPRLLGEGDAGKELFGKYSVVTGAVAIFNALVVQGTTQAVSRFVGRDPAEADGVRRAAYKLQAMIGGGLFAVVFLSAPYLARETYNDPALETPLRCAAFITLFYAFYAVCMGYLNGSRQFGRQAIADFAYSTFKVIGVLGGAVILMKLLDEPIGGVAGGVGGFAAAAGMVALLAYLLAGRAKGPGTMRVMALLVFQVFTMAFTFCATWVSRGDLQILKVGLKHLEDRVDQLAAEYTAAQAFATIPYQAVFAITFILFPLVAGAAGRDLEKMRLYIRQTTRYAAMIAAMIGGLFFFCPERTITILFPPTYVPAATSLQILCAGYVLYSVFFIMCATITASGKPWVSLSLVSVTVGLQIAIGAALVSRLEMIGVAIGTATGMAVGFVAAHLYLRKTYGQGVMLYSFVRILLCAAATGLLADLLLGRSLFWGGSGFLADVGGTGIAAKALTAGGFGVLGLVYLVLLGLTGVLDAEDRAKFMKIVKRS